MYNLFLAFAVYITSIYSLQFTDSDGNLINISSFQNKKILLVNIATGSPKAGQLSALQQLHQTYGDSLVIIAFPSNSFGNEARTNAEIKLFCQTSYGVTFRIAEKTAVTGAGIHPVYNWLTHVSENGTMSAVLAKDFQKFLIDKDGRLIGTYGASISPLDSQLVNAITGN